MRALTLLIMLLAAYSLVAQSKYAFGKRNTIGYTSNFLHFGDPLNIKENEHAFTFQRLITRKKSLIFEYATVAYQSKFNFLGSPRFKYTYTDSNNIQSDRYLTLLNPEIFKIKTYNFGLRTFVKSKGAVAPYGCFLEFKTGFTVVELPKKDWKGAYRDQYGNIITSDLPNQGLGNLNALSFQLGYGLAKPVTKNLIFTALINFHLNITLNQLYYSDIVYFADENYLTNAQMVLNENNTLKLNLGLHYAF